MQSEIVVLRLIHDLALGHLDCGIYSTACPCAFTVCVFMHAL